MRSRRNHAEDVVIVPGPARFRGFLDLGEIHVVDQAPVFAKAAIPCVKIIDRYIAHLGHDCLGFVRARRGDGFMTDGGIDAGLRLCRHRAVARKKSFLPGAASLVAIPVKGGCEFQSLRSLQPDAVRVGNEHRQRHDRLAAAR